MTTPLTAWAILSTYRQGALAEVKEFATAKAAVQSWRRRPLARDVVWS